MSSSLIIHLWSGPRSLSTCTLYSFGHRSDTKAIDEPLYASWLASNSEIYRPYREELLSCGNVDGNQVLSEILVMDEKPIIFLKHVAKQLAGLDRATLFHERARHIFLVRDPTEMIDGWQRRLDIHREECSLETLGLPIMCELYSELKRKAKYPPIVVDADILQKHPKEVLQDLCEQLAIEFQESQLSWPEGPKPHIDGLWASYWYTSLHSSTGFTEKASIKAGLVDNIDLLREAIPFYEMLSRHAIGRNVLNPGSSMDTSVFSEAATDKKTIIDHGLKLSVSDIRLADSRNEHILVWIGDRLVPREFAKVSVFDSAVQGGDAVWEGLRVYQGRVLKLCEHLQRLQDSAKAMAFKGVPSNDFIQNAIFTTLQANNMLDGVHIRLTLTRGPKLTSSMNPVFNVFGCCLIVLPEWKPVGDMTTYDNSIGIKLITACNRRNPAQCVDSKIHHCNLINNILPKIQANCAGAADALMLDVEGFVSETNATNVFMIKHGVVYTPTADSCLPGVTRATVIQLCQKLSIPIIEKRISLTEFYAADEVFTTGTMGELTPVFEIDGRTIGHSLERELTRRLQDAYRHLTIQEGVPITSF